MGNPNEIPSKGYQLLLTEQLDGLAKSSHRHETLVSLFLWLIKLINTELKEELKDVSLEIVKAQYVSPGYPCLAIHYFNRENPKDVGPIVEAAVERLLSGKKVLDLVSFLVENNIDPGSKLKEIMD